MTPNIQRLALACFAAVGAAALMAPGVASALPTRTWVSAIGNDGNDCSIGSPCQTFAVALTKTAAHGEIDALTPGGYGPVTIDKAITIAGNGVGAVSIVVSGSDAITIAAGASDVVTLRGLQLNGVTAGVNGVRMTTGGSLKIEDCVIEHFSGTGVLDNDTQPHQILIADTYVTDNATGGIMIQPGATGGVTTGALTRVRVQNNSFGIRIDAKSDNAPIGVTVEDSTIANNVNAGAAAVSSGTPAELLLIRSSLVANGGAGINVNGASATVKASGSLIAHNGGVAMSASNGGLAESFGDNLIKGNQGGDGNFGRTNLE